MREALPSSDAYYMDKGMSLLGRPFFGIGLNSGNFGNFEKSSICFWINSRISRKNSRNSQKISRDSRKNSRNFVKNSRFRQLRVGDRCGKTSKQQACIVFSTKGLFISLPNFGMPFSNVPFWTLRNFFGAKIMARYFGNKMACHF